MSSCIIIVSMIIVVFGITCSLCFCIRLYVLYMFLFHSVLSVQRCFHFIHFFSLQGKKIEKETRQNRKSKRRRGVILLRVAKAGRQTSKKFSNASQSPCHHIVFVSAIYKAVQNVGC